MSHLEQIRELRRMAVVSGLDCCLVNHGRRQVPRMAFGPALSAGCESRCEYADLFLEQRCPESVVAARLSASASEFFSLLSVKRVPVFFPSIEASVSAVQYLIEAEPVGRLSRACVDAFFARESALVERTGPTGAGTVDARPLVLGAELDAPSGIMRLKLRLEPGKNVKPAEVLGLMAGGEVPVRRLVREELFWLDSKGKLEII